jgi:hypothetical protein
MTGLREMFQDVAGAAGPPSRLRADELYAAGRQRRRRRAALTGVVAGAAAIVLAVVTVGVVNLQAGPPPVRPAAPSVTPGPEPSDRPQWAGGYDARHLYQAYLRCSAEPRTPACDKSAFQVTASHDGGRTWGPLGARVQAGSFLVIGPRTLIATVGATPPRVQVSTDGGGTWGLAVQSSQPVWTVPAAATVVCLGAGDGVAPCALYAVDPGSGAFSLLAGKPPVLADRDTSLAPVTQDGTRLWVAGSEPVSGRPAVAESADAGRTWSMRTLPGPGKCAARCLAPELLSGTDGARYAVVNDRRQHRLWAFRADRTGWTPLAGAHAVPYADITLSSVGFVAGDGRLVLAQPIRERGQGLDWLRFWAAPRSDPSRADYQPVPLDGLPATVHSIRRTPDGFYYALSYGDDTLYGSADGWHWSPVGSR